MKTERPVIALCDLPRDVPIELPTLAHSMGWEGRAGRLRLRRQLKEIHKVTPVLLHNGTHYFVILNALEKAWPAFGRRAVQTEEIRDRLAETEEELRAEQKRRTLLEAEVRKYRARQRESEERIVKLEDDLEKAVRTFQEASKRWFTRPEAQSGVRRMAPEAGATEPRERLPSTAG